MSTIRKPLDLTHDVPKNVILPLVPKVKYLNCDKRTEMSVYARFMRHLRLVPNSAFDIKILSSIQFTADMLNLGDDYVAKILVDCGLRAPRKSFPASFLRFADQHFTREEWDLEYASKPLFDLRNFWLSCGERQNEDVDQKTHKSLLEFELTY